MKGTGSRNKHSYIINIWQESQKKVNSEEKIASSTNGGKKTG